MIDRKTLKPGDWIEVRDPSRHVSYGQGGVGAFQVAKVGRVNVKASIDIRFSPTGPWYRQEHTIPLSHVVRVIPSDEIVTRTEEVQMPRKTFRKGASSATAAEAAGEQYAYDQIAGEYYGDWVRDQLIEASKMPPDKVLPLETKADARVVAKNMLRQLEWDTKRALRGSELEDLIGTPTQASHTAFYEGFRKACDGSLDWLADELLTIKHEMHSPQAHEARRASVAARRSTNSQPGSESRSRLASYIAHAVMYDISTDARDLISAYHLSPEEAAAVMSNRGGWYGPGGKGYGAFVKHIEKALKKKTWFSAPEPKLIPGADRAYGRYVWLLENAAPPNTDQGRKDKSDIEDLQRELTNVGFNGWGLTLDNWPEAKRYYNAADSVYRRGGAGEARTVNAKRRYGNTLTKYRPGKIYKHLKVDRVVPSNGAHSVEFNDGFSVQVHGGSGRDDILYAMRPYDMRLEQRAPGPESRRDYQYAALKAVLDGKPADFVVDYDGDVQARLTEVVRETHRPKARGSARRKR